MNCRNSIWLWCKLNTWPSYGRKATIVSRLCLTAWNNSLAIPSYFIVSLRSNFHTFCWLSMGSHTLCPNNRQRMPQNANENMSFKTSDHTKVLNRICCRENWQLGIREDWRFTDLRQKFGKNWWWMSFFATYLSQHTMLIGLTFPVYIVSLSSQPYSPILDRFAKLVSYTGKTDWSETQAKMIKLR